MQSVTYEINRITPASVLRAIRATAIEYTELTGEVSARANILVPFSNNGFYDELYVECVYDAETLETMYAIGPNMCLGIAQGNTRSFDHAARLLRHIIGEEVVLAA